MLRRNILLFIVFLLAVGSSINAQSKSFKEDKNITYNGFIYSYDPSTKLEASKEQGEGYSGNMSVRREGGDIAFLQNTKESPGCDIGFPAVSLIDVPVADSTKTAPYVLFCGTFGGKPTTLRFYKPGDGIVSAFRISGAPFIEKHKNVLSLTTYQEIVIGSKGLRLSYPEVYSITSNGLGVNMTLDTSDVAQQKYRTLLKQPYYASASDKVIVEKLIISALANDKKSYCESAKKIKDIAFINELSKEIMIPYFQCKEN